MKELEGNECKECNGWGYEIGGGGPDASRPCKTCNTDAEVWSDKKDWRYGTYHWELLRGDMSVFGKTCNPERRMLECLRRRAEHLRDRVEKSPKPLSYDKQEYMAIVWALLKIAEGGV